MQIQGQASITFKGENRQPIQPETLARLKAELEVSLAAAAHEVIVSYGLRHEKESPLLKLETLDITN